ncbi:aquaporin Z [Bifidobacterium commune]|uniref:Aquaporin Z n=1 Tax=Bifidobacterium commune TaxID=1505727 RepID=A0A1C4H256_9BIFI|nr:aquaporin [Bifidobacterium commune]MBB2954816.1 aquaporin Z [Bifidobacterium commune]SCC78842.1 aquaporin Z [Bifidobacterium commune]
MSQLEVQPVEETSKTKTLAAIGSELIGSFLIFLTIYLVSSLSPSMYGASVLLIAIATGLVYAAMIAVFGQFSGGQFNPAVTLVAILTGRTTVLNGIFYIIMQLCGAIAAGSLVRFILPTSQTATAKMWLSAAVNGFDEGSVSATQLQSAGLSFGVLPAVIVEIAAAIIIIATAVYLMNRDDVSSVQSAASMGIAYTVGVILTYPITGSSLNPARSTGIAIAAQNIKLTVNPLHQLFIFWICPILTAAIVSIIVITCKNFGQKTPVEVVEVEENAEIKEEDFADPTNLSETNPSGDANFADTDADVENDSATEKI